MKKTQNQNLNNSAQESSKPNFTEIKVGSRVFCVLYGGSFGTVVKIHGIPSPETIEVLFGGMMVSGGSAHYDIIWDNGTQSPQVPESIINGVQWRILDEELVTEEEIKLLYEKAEMTKAAQIKAEKEEKEAIERRRYELLNDVNYSHLIPLINSHQSIKEVHKNIRADLKKYFPTTKFSVTGDYDAVRIRWTDGPQLNTLRNFIIKFESYSTDFTGDYRDPTPSAFNDVFGGKKYVFTERCVSDEAILKALTIVKNKLNLDYDLSVEDVKNGSYYNENISGFSEPIQYYINQALKDL